MTLHVTIPLDEDVLRRARTCAADLGLSLEDYIQRLVAEGTSAGPVRPVPDVTAFFNLGESTEPTDIAVDKDRMVGDAVWDRHRKRTGQE